MLIATKRDQEQPDAKDSEESMPFDDALRQILKAKPKHKTAPKKPEPPKK